MSAVTVCSDFGSQENRGFLFLQNKPRLLPWPSWLCVIEPLAVSQASSPSNLLALVLLYPYFSFNSPNRHSSPPLSLWTRCPLPWWASDGLLLSIQSWTKHWPTYLRWLPACSTLQLLSASLLIAFFHGSPQWCDVMPSATPRGLSVHEAGGWVSLVSLHILHTPTLLAPN